MDDGRPRYGVSGRLGPAFGPIRGPMDVGSENRTGWRFRGGHVLFCRTRGIGPGGSFTTLLRRPGNPQCRAPRSAFHRQSSPNLATRDERLALVFGARQWPRSSARNGSLFSRTMKGRSESYGRFIVGSRRLRRDSRHPGNAPHGRHCARNPSTPCHAHGAVFAEARSEPSLGHKYASAAMVGAFAGGGSSILACGQSDFWRHDMGACICTCTRQAPLSAPPLRPDNFTSNLGRVPHIPVNADVPFLGKR